MNSVWFYKSYLLSLLNLAFLSFTEVISHNEKEWRWIRYGWSLQKMRYISQTRSIYIRRIHILRKNTSITELVSATSIYLCYREELSCSIHYSAWKETIRVYPYSISESVLWKYFSVSWSYEKKFFNSLVLFISLRNRASFPSAKTFTV